MEFTNIAHIIVTESAANTLTFKKLETGISINQKVGWLVHKLEYYFQGVLLTGTTFDGTNDTFAGALCGSNSFTDIDDQSNPAILDLMYLRRLDAGVATSMIVVSWPLIKDFSMLPGGGLLIPPSPLYLAAKGTGLAAAATLRVRIYYSPIDLKTEDYWQLLEMYRLTSS